MLKLPKIRIKEGLETWFRRVLAKFKCHMFESSKCSNVKGGRVVLLLKGLSSKMIDGNIVENS